MRSWLLLRRYLSSQQSNSVKKIRKATSQERIFAGIILVLILSVAAVLFLASRGIIDLGMVFGVCGFKQRYDLPCPGCYMTHSAQAFVQGRIIESFCIQPAAAIFCAGFTVTAVFSLLISVFGLKFWFLSGQHLTKLFKWIVISAVLLIIVGWGITLLREMALNG